MSGILSQSEREELYTRLCKVVDAVGPERESLFLAQLSLLLMERVGSFEIVSAQIDAASGHDRDASYSSPPES
jgi:hypothetical protein